MSIKSNAVKVKATLQFPHFETQDNYNGKDVGYGVILGDLSEAAVDAIEEAFGDKDFNGRDRIKQKETLDFGKHLKVKSKFPLVPVDVDGESFEGRTGEIGYGSRAEVVLKADKSGQPRAVKIIVTEMVTAEGGDDFDGDAV